MAKLKKETKQDMIIRLLKEVLAELKKQNEKTHMMLEWTDEPPKIVYTCRFCGQSYVNSHYCHY